MTHTCPACTTADAIQAHRDTYAADWSPRRAAFNFAVILARRACAEYRAEIEENR